MSITRPANPRGAAPLPSSALLRGQKSVLIEHQGLIYRLQETKLGKLILTK
jgi:hemin uptake protein HemP